MQKYTVKSASPVGTVAVGGDRVTTGQLPADQGRMAREKGACHDFLETTSLKGFSRIVKSDGISLRILWIVAVVVGLSFTVYQVFELFTQYLSYTATTQMYDKREEAPFPDVSICNLESNLDDVIAVKDYLTKLDDVIAQNQEDIDVVNQVQGLKNKFALFQNLDNASLEEIDRYFVAQCFWITNKRLHINCSESVSRLIYTETFGQCYTFSTLLWRNTGEAHGIYSIKVLLYLNQFQSGNSHLIRNKFHQVDQMNGGGVKVSVHEQGTLADVEGSGVNVPTGVRAQLTVNPTRTRRLRSPYSDCQDKDTVDHVTFSGQTLRYTPFACRELAEQRFIAGRCGCMAGELLSTPDLRASHLFCEELSANISHTIDRRRCAAVWRPNQSSFEWMRSCPDPCDYYTYPVSVSIVPSPLDFQSFAFYSHYIKDKPYKDKFRLVEDLEFGLYEDDENFTRTLTAAASLIRNNFVHLEISFRTLYVEYRVERASVSLEGFVGSAGGILNLWSGIIFIVLFEIIELSCKTCRRTFKTQDTNVTQIKI